MDPELFNEKYSRCVRKALIKLRKDPWRRVPKRAPYYRLPPEIIEFCDTADILMKSYAHPLRVRITTAPYPYTYGSGKGIFDCISWVKFMEDRNGYELYVNCDPESEHYGYILRTHLQMYFNKIIYRNVHELVSDITIWFSMVSDTCKIDLDEYLDGICTYDGEQIKNRDVFLSKYDNIHVIHIHRDIVLDKIKFPEYFKWHKNLSFLSWIDDKPDLLEK